MEEISIQKRMTTLQMEKKLEVALQRISKLEADLSYLAMMSNIDLGEDDDNDSDETE